MIANAAPEPEKLMSPAEIQQQKLTISNLAQSNRLGQAKVEQLDDSGLVRSAVQKSTTIDPANKQPVTDHSAVVGALVSGGRGDLAQQYQSQVQQEQAAKTKQFYDTHKQDLSIMAQLLNGVKAVPPEKRDQAYQTAKQQFTQLTGKPSSGVPDQWDDAWGDQMIGQVRSLDEQFKQQGAEKLQEMKNSGDMSVQTLKNQGDIESQKLKNQGDASANNAKLRPIPATIGKALVANSQSLENINRALKLLEEQPQAFGLSNVMGDTVRQRTDPNGVSARAAVADIGSLKIHDRSGAAVTAAETPRLKPFIPSANDNPKTVKKKLELLKEQYQQEQDAINTLYAEDQGYRPAPKLTGETGNSGKTGGVLHVDAEGNQALVYPDGSYEEVN